MVSRDIKFIEEKCGSDPSDIQHEDHSYHPDLPIRLPRLEVQQQEDAANCPPQNRKNKSLIELYE